MMQIFNKNWHKIHFGVFAKTVILYIDCKKIQIDDVRTELESRGTIDVSGKISLSKLLSTNSTMPVSKILKIHMISNIFDYIYFCFSMYIHFYKIYVKIIYNTSLHKNIDFNIKILIFLQNT